MTLQSSNKENSMRPGTWKEMVSLNVLVVVLFIHGGFSNMCTNFNSLPGLNKRLRLPGYDIVNMTTDGIMGCARNCLSRSWCKSFNFQATTGLCELKFEGLISGRLSNSDLVPAPGYVFSDISHFPQTVAGECAHHTCDLNTYCQPTGTGYTCVLYIKPTSCVEVKECDPSATDGEYWIRLMNFGLYRTRIYCHNMTTDSPTEFLTLPNPNHGHYPRKANVNCVGETELPQGCMGKGGDIVFDKVQVDITSMEVIRDSLEFANISEPSENVTLIYAMAADCWTPHYDGNLATCEAQGRFTIDLTGTGWAVDPQMTLDLHGWKPILQTYDRNAEGTIIHMRCGGYGGTCEPDGALLLVQHYLSIPEASARDVTCSIPSP